MLPRHRVLQLVTLLLYLGPLLAGLAGQGLAVAPAFVALFVLWQIVMRPADWPRRMADWSGDGVIAGALSRVILMVVLVVVCYGVGRGLSGLMGGPVQLPKAVPLLMSFLAIPLARMLWNPAEAVAMDTFLDQAIARVQGTASPDAAHLAGAEGLADRFLEPLAAFPDDTPPERIASHLRAMGTQVDDARLRAALIERVGAGAPAPIVMALAVHATNPALIEKLGAARAFAVMPDDPAALAVYAQHAEAALAVDADLAHSLPASGVVLDRATRLAGTSAEAPLRALSERLAAGAA